MLTTTFAAAQALLVTAVLAFAGASKLSLREGLDVGAEKPLERFLPNMLAVAWIALGVLELALAPIALVPTLSRIGLVLASALFCAFVGYQMWALRAAPGAPCGCFGSRLHDPISRMTILRTGLLAIAAATGAAAGGTSVLTSSSVPGAVGLAFIELGVLALLVPSTREQAVRTIRLRRDGADCATAKVPIEVTLAALQHSDIWHRWSPHLDTQNIRDRWRSGCWRFISYDANHRGRRAVAVFAVRVAYRDPIIRIALVDVESDVVLASDGDSGAVPAVAVAAVL
jgi:hypothetical protein